MARTTTDEDRKAPYGVSLTRAQREKFIALGGSQWLQKKLDKELAKERPEGWPKGWGKDGHCASTGRAT